MGTSIGIDWNFETFKALLCLMNPFGKYEGGKRALNIQLLKYPMMYNGAMEYSITRGDGIKLQSRFDKNSMRVKLSVITKDKTIELENPIHNQKSQRVAYDGRIIPKKELKTIGDIIVENGGKSNFFEKITDKILPKISHNYGTYIYKSSTNHK